MELVRIGKVFSSEDRSFQGKDGSTIQRVALVLDCTEVHNGMEFPSFPSFECGEKLIPQLKELKKDDVVSVTFSYDGRFFTKKDGTQGHIDTARAYKIEKRNVTSNADTTQAVPMQQPAQQQAVQAPQQEAPAKADDLPF